MPESKRDAASAFCAVEYPRLVGSLTLYVGSQAVAEELAQEALLRAFRRWEYVHRLDAPSAWVWRVAMNLANSHFRRRGAERRARSRLRHEARAADESHDAAGAIAVRRAVACLPERQRAAVILRYFLDLPVQETARRMDASADAVRSLTKRAVAALRDEFAADATTTEVHDE